MFTKRHYRSIGYTLRESIQPKLSKKDYNLVVAKFVDMFSKDNELFSSEIFKKYCHIE